MSGRVVTLVASLAAHAVLTLIIVRLAPSAPRPAPEPLALEVALVRSRVSVPLSPLRGEGGGEGPVPDVATNDTRASRHRAAAIRTRASALEATSESTAPTATPSPAPGEPGPGDPRECPPIIVPIDPFSVAARALTPSGPASGTIDTGARTDGRQADLEEALRGSVRGPDVSRRPPPPITPSDDGGYDVRGIRLAAHIRPDGTIAFLDGPPIEDVGPMSTPGNRDTQTSGSMGVGFRFDLNDGVFQAAGEDPLRTERQYLLRETQELRDRLSLRARRVDEERGIMALGERLREIVADRSLSAAARRQAIFEVWDDCATDAIGERARAIVEDFARQRFPQGTALAYTVAELTRLNRGRVTGRAFDPYRSAPDAGAADGGA